MHNLPLVALLAARFIVKPDATVPDSASKNGMGKRNLIPFFGSLIQPSGVCLNVKLNVVESNQWYRV